MFDVVGWKTPIRDSSFPAFVVVAISVNDFLSYLMKDFLTVSSALL